MDEEVKLEDLIAEIAKYEYAQSRKPLIAMEKLIRDSHGNARQRKQIAKQLAALIASGDATTDAKRFACNQLSLVGTRDEVAALAALLTDKDLSHMARLALERIPQTPAGDALREALNKTKGDLCVGVINSLAVRRDRRSARALVELLGDSDPKIAAAAAAALGDVAGDTRAIRALARAHRKAPPKLRPVLADACLKCAERLLAADKKDAAARLYEELAGQSEAKLIRAAAKRGLAAARNN